MTRPAIVSDAALEDRDAAADWYESQRGGLGARFKRAVRETLSAIEERPESFPAVDDRYRRALVPEFPYAVFFRIEADRVFVRAILHGHRDPQTLRRRLGGD
jgi:plasmid stabilization system protein ParE